MYLYELFDIFLLEPNVGVNDFILTKNSQKIVFHNKPSSFYCQVCVISVPKHSNMYLFELFENFMVCAQRGAQQKICLSKKPLSFWIY